MKFGVLALDYDGTIAKDGVLDPDVRAAIEEVRAHGIISVLVTGRILTELRSLMGDLRLFDCVVAENGAVVAFPNAGRSTAHGHSPAPAFLEELTRRGIKFARGECVVEADAELACQILSVIREMELPLVVLFNRGRMMVLPQAITATHDLPVFESPATSTFRPRTASDIGCLLSAVPSSKRRRPACLGDNLGRFATSRM